MRPIKDSNGESFAQLVSAELSTAREYYAPMVNAHEAYAVIQEEVEEFWQEVKKRPALWDKYMMLRELVQIAAMCRRAAEDLNLME